MDVVISTIAIFEEDLEIDKLLIDMTNEVIEMRNSYYDSAMNRETEELMYQDDIAYIKILDKKINKALEYLGK